LDQTRETVKFAEPDISDREIDAVVGVMKSGWLSTGPKCLQLEKWFHDSTKKTALAASSATAAQLIAMRAWMDVRKIKPGSKIIVSGLTFASTVLNCLHLGLVPVFCDIDPDTLQPTVKTIQEAKCPDAVAVLVTHYAGYPCSMDEIKTWCNQRRMFLIDDAAHCLPTTYKKWEAGAWPSDITFFSFYATKTVACGEGGMVVIQDEEIARIAKQYRLHGMSRDTFDRYKSTSASWEYDIVVEGYKANLPDILAAIALVQLERMHELHDKRIRIWNRYLFAFEDLDQLELPWADSKNVQQSSHLYPLRVEENRNEFMNGLREQGVVASMHFKPFYRMSLWKGEKPHLPVLNDFADRQVSLPIFSTMTDAQVEQVIEAVKHVLQT